jgi:arsenate reductase
VTYTLRRYLDDPPSEAELRAALSALGLEPWDITRLSEPLAHELGLRTWSGTPTRGSGCWPSTRS